MTKNYPEDARPGMARMTNEATRAITVGKFECYLEIEGHEIYRACARPTCLIYY